MSGLRPTPEQQAILELGLRPIRVRAGAGTGKTTTVAMVIANLLAKHGVSPEEVLGMTFTNKAAAELADRVRESMPKEADPGRQPEIHTYHGFAAQVLAEFGPFAGVDSRARVITPTYGRQLLTESFYNGRYESLDITVRNTLEKVRRLGDRMGDHLLTPDDISSASPDEPDEVWARRLEMIEALRAYSLDKRRLGVVDYSDLVSLTTRLAEAHPELASAIRERYRVVVLDEYQDTNPAQRRLLTSIFTTGFPVIAVGDEDQTIYEWRGASAENFTAFTSHFPDAEGNPAVDTSLRLNRRSTQPILDIANQVRRMANPDSEELVPAVTGNLGEVVTFWAGNALEEAEWIARRFEELHDSGKPWSDMAVLLRKNKDFAVMVDAMARHDIPVEVANIGGLLSVPEVSELRAWLSILERPEDSASLVQILSGSSYRLGLADLAPLSRWLAAEEADDSDETAQVTLLEAIENAAHVEGLRPEATAAFDRFQGIYRDLLVESQGLSLIEISRLILDRTRAWADIEALGETPRLTARLNIYRFLDATEQWSPLAGRPSLRAFLDYLEIMEEEPADELDSAHLSGQDAVTLVTVHRAKGLEWDTVALPTLTRGNFPSSASQLEDPVRFAEHIPPELRLDAAFDALPDDAVERREFLRHRHNLQEWRVAYVAVTRAKRRLYATGAYWYGLPEPLSKPKEPSELFELVARSEASTSAGHAEPIERPDLLRPSPVLADPDPIFEDGWQAALRGATARPESVDAMAAKLGVASAYQDLVAEVQGRLFAMEEPDSPTAHPIEAVSVTGAVTYAQCPKRFHWSYVDPLPRRHNPAAVRGTEIHRQIELHQRGQVPLELAGEDHYDSGADETAPMGSGGLRAFLRSRFATARPALIEAPFGIETADGTRVRGRIDAVYSDEDHHWEIVDFKSGTPRDDPSRIVQLQAYAVAAEQVDFGIPGPASLDATFAYLGGEQLEEQRHHADPDWMADARATLDHISAGIRAERFPATPGAWCNNCDFLRFCEEGRDFIGS